VIRHRRAFGSIVALLAFGVLLPASEAEVLTGQDRLAPPEVADPGEVAYRTLIGLPVGDEEAGRDGVARSAVALAAALRAVPVAEGSVDACPQDRLAVSWEEPGSSYGHGAFVDPLGPAPKATTTEVNGVVTCTGAPWAFMGFEARYAGGRWDVVAVPFVDEAVHEDEEDHDDHEDASEEHGDARAAVASRAPAVSPAPAGQPAAAPSTMGAFSGPIDGYARYEPQRTCSPTAKPGTVALQRLLLAGAPGSRSLGISRGCSIGGSSEHKEGRAFDWGVVVTRPSEAAAAEDFLGRLLATDADGNRHALARRMGVMYVIWNRQMWSAYRPNDGWRPYSGRSPHTDHVHISLSWDGALGRTSFWSGNAVAGLDFATQASRSASSPSPSPTAIPSAVAPGPSTPPSTAPAHDHAAEAEGQRKQEERARVEQAAQEEAHRQQQKAAAEEAHRQQKAAAEEARRQQKALEGQVRRQRAAEHEIRRQQAAIEQEARRREQVAAAQARRDREAVEKQRPPAAGGAGAPAGGNGGGKGKGKGKGGG
jgi:hypothetical protein